MAFRPVRTRNYPSVNIALMESDEAKRCSFRGVEHSIGGS